MACRLVQRAVVALLMAVMALSGIVPGAAAAEASPTVTPGSFTPSQLAGSRILTPPEAQAACGPAAAVALAHATGRNISLDAAVAAAREVGWTPARGMPGPYGQLKLLQRLSIAATLEAGLDSSRIAREVRAGRPVIVRTSGRSASQPGHYFVAERFDAASGKFDLAQSALVLRSAAGRRWFALHEIAALGTGVPTHAIYLTPGVSVPPTVATTRSITVMSAGAPSAIVGTGTHQVETGGPAARLRAAAGTDARIVARVPNGTRLRATGTTTMVAGRLWRQVRVADGTVAWIDDGLLTALP